MVHDTVDFFNVRLRILVVSTLLLAIGFTSAQRQNKKPANVDDANPECSNLFEAPLDTLLKSPPVLPSHLNLIESLPRRVLMRFTNKKSPHVEKVLNCLESNNHPGCTLEGYKQVASKKWTIDSQISAKQCQNAIFLE